MRWGARTTAILWALRLVACKRPTTIQPDPVASTSVAPSPPPPPPPVKKPAEKTTITLTRTACYGTCPAYELSVSDDGQVVWRGDSNVAIPGERRWQIPREDAAKLIAAFDAARFFELDDRGEIPVPCDAASLDCIKIFLDCSDTPHAILTFRRGDAKHETNDAHCSNTPNVLTELEDRVDSIARAKPYIRPK